MWEESWSVVVGRVFCLCSVSLGGVCGFEREKKKHSFVFSLLSVVGVVLVSWFESGT